MAGGELVLGVGLKRDPTIDHLTARAGGNQNILTFSQDVLQQQTTILSLMYVTAVVRSWA